MTDLTVVVLAYNEAATLGALIDEFLAVLSGLTVSWDLLIVDDGSTDGTAALADQFALVHAAIHVVHHAQNRGLGAAYATGFETATGDCITLFPGDGQFPPQHLPQYLEAARQHDLVLGFLPDPRRTPVGVVLSWLERALYQLLFGRLPRFQGPLLIRRQVLRKIPIVSVPGRNWANVFELIVRLKRRGYRIVSIPVSLRPRRSGQSKVNNFSTILANLKQVLTLRLLLDEPVRPAPGDRGSGVGGQGN